MQRRPIVQDGPKALQPAQEACFYFDANPALQFIVVPDAMVYDNFARALHAFVQVDGKVLDVGTLPLGWRKD